MSLHTKTADVIAEMLRENTGTHFLDSGGDNGRHWQRNQGRQFDREHECSLTFRWGYPEVTINVYHFLAQHLEYNAELDGRFQRWAEDREDTCWLQDMQVWVESRPDAAGIYGEGEPVTVNTYNGEDLLSQTLQFVYWTDADGAHVLLQVHGGCDVRGGYTRPRAFDVRTDLECEGVGIFDNCRATIAPDPDTLPGRPDDHVQTLPGFERHVETPGQRRDRARDVYWTTDDGCHWYFQGSTGHTELQEYDRVNFDEEGRDEDGRELDDVRGTGVLCVDEDGNGYCPITGGLLRAYMY